MSWAVDTFLNWFKGLTRQQQEEVLKYIYSRTGWAEVQVAYKGYFVGSAPLQQTDVCPTCGKKW